MINFKCSSSLEVYAARQLNFMLGIKVKNEIYASFNNNDESGGIQFTTEKGNKILINTDFLELCSQFLSLKREKNMPHDSFGRVIFSEKQAKTISTPLLDIELKKVGIELTLFLDENEISFEKINFLDGPTLCLSHDVDSLKSNSILRFFYNILKSIVKLDLISLLKLIKKRSNYINTHGDLETFIEIEENYSFKSSYFFLSLPFFLGREGRRYSINSKSVKTKLELLAKKKFEIGLHMSRKGYVNTKLGNREIRRLEQAAKKTNITGVRNHYLKGNFPHIWNSYEQLFDYDSSLGSSEYLIYRAGTSKPFNPYDYQTKKELEIVEVPLIVMDGALRGTSDQIYHKVKNHIDIAYENNSLISILWHTDRILPDDFSDHAEAYQKILAYLHELKFNSLTIEELVKRYKNHQNQITDNLKFS